MKGFKVEKKKISAVDEDQIRDYLGNLYSEKLTVSNRLHPEVREVEDVLVKLLYIIFKGAVEIWEVHNNCRRATAVPSSKKAERTIQKTQASQLHFGL